MDGWEGGYPECLAEFLREALRLVWSNADDPSQILHQHMRPLLENVHTIHLHALRAHPGTPLGPAHALDWEQVLRQVLAFDWDRRSKCQTLGLLCPKLGGPKVPAPRLPHPFPLCVSRCSGACRTADACGGPCGQEQAQRRAVGSSASTRKGP